MDVHARRRAQSQNLKLIGSVERTRFDSTYRNSDLAFWGDRVYAGHYDGFQIVDASDPENPRQLVDHPCPGSQHDVSVWEDLLFVSVETPRSSADCDSVRQSPGFEAMRIFDVSDPTAPELIAGVPTDCGSHTHTLVPDAEHGRVLLYVASYTVGHHDPHGANTWLAYWYNGHIYTNDGGRGVDVMLLTDRARAAAQKLPHSNPQTQDAVLR